MSRWPGPVSPCGPASSQTSIKPPASRMDNKRFDLLLQQYFDGHLAGEEKDELEIMLLAEPAARREFWRSVQVHILLRLHGEAEWGRKAAAQPPIPTKSLAATVKEKVLRSLQFRGPWTGLA